MRSSLESQHTRTLRHYLLGGSPEVNNILRLAIARDFPSALICGASSPPFQEFDEALRETISDALTASRADIVWVGLGTPKQDIEAERLAQVHPAMFIAVGAAFDYLAGTLDESPNFLRKLGLQWAHRFIKEPARLWRRYLFGNATFIRLVIRAFPRSASSTTLSSWLDQYFR